MTVTAKNKTEIKEREASANVRCEHGHIWRMRGTETHKVDPRYLGVRGIMQIGFAPAGPSRCQICGGSFREIDLGSIAGFGERWYDTEFIPKRGTLLAEMESRTNR